MIIIIPCETYYFSFYSFPTIQLYSISMPLLILDAKLSIQRWRNKNRFILLHSSLYSCVYSHVTWLYCYITLWANTWRLTDLKNKTILTREKMNFKEKVLLREFSTNRQLSCRWNVATAEMRTDIDFRWWYR